MSNTVVRNINKTINGIFKDIRDTIAGRKERMKRASKELNDLAKLMNSMGNYKEKDKHKQKILNMLNVWEEKYPVIFKEVFMEKYIERGKIRKKVGLRERVQKAGMGNLKTGAQLAFPRVQLFSKKSPDSVQFTETHDNIIKYKMPTGKYPEIEKIVKKMNIILVGKENEIIIYNNKTGTERYGKKEEISRDDVLKIARKISELIHEMKITNFKGIDEKQKEPIKKYILQQINAMNNLAHPGDISDIFNIPGLKEIIQEAGRG